MPQINTKEKNKFASGNPAFSYATPKTTLVEVPNGDSGMKTTP